ncbi:MAG: type II toxin-antitoxin system HicA family toxin [Duncaniella sp.]|nr:type II toxin-antitoxin system HicA family toxin [Duncaniella sp.]
MAKIQKLVERLLRQPKDFTYDEAKTILIHFGFEERTKGKTSGSRVEFVKDADSILMHKPHPTGELKTYQVKQLVEFLSDLNLV